MIISINIYLKMIKNENILLNTIEYVGNLLKQSNGSNDIDRIKNVFKHLSKKKDDNNYYINYDDLKNEINFDNFKKLENKNKNKFNKYKFDTDEDIIKSFKKLFRENKYHINLIVNQNIK